MIVKTSGDKEIFTPISMPRNFNGILFCNNTKEIALVWNKEDMYSVGFTGYSGIRKGYDELLLYNRWKVQLFQLKSFQEVLDIMRNK